MEGLLASFGSLKIDEEAIKRFRVSPVDNAKYHFKPIFDLIEQKDWIKEHFQNPKGLLDNFVEVHGNTLKPQNFSEILKLALVAEYRNEIDFSDQNSIPSGAFALNPTEDQGGGEVSIFVALEKHLLMILCAYPLSTHFVAGRGRGNYL